MNNRLSQRRLWAGAAAITTLCAHYTTVLMATSSSGKLPKAQWNDAEVDALVDYLHDHKAEAGDGGNFKASTFNAAAAHIKPYLLHGPMKTGKMCRGKWTTVRQFFDFAIEVADTYSLSSKRHIRPSKPIAINQGFTGIIYLELIFRVMQQQVFGTTLQSQRFVIT